ncbi:hypothetical protein AMD27_17650 (plasmid) [Acinetobacter sp. TGL-Y2]|uniref:hypothetical protein n=1 Tax=Acinetobacter sp. TGL-Y2 TaxID=1407071 RepID=UPI0007A67E26|nr:hypothetical protein [Acinetobacter sp. TGL-Y2]AMW80741.1 hypothetical protein AMD27_17650 [Acinetobacter sp. TGL-Y2]
MSIPNQLSNAFEYILDSDYSLIKKYRKPEPIFEPKENLFDFDATDNFPPNSINICEYNPDLSLLRRYKVALELCGFNVYTKFDGFEEIKALFNEPHHNWHSVLKTISDYKNNNICSRNVLYKAFVHKYALSLIIDERDQQIVFFMPLTAKMYRDEFFGGSCISDFFTLFVLIPKRKIKQFSAYDLYDEMRSHKFNSSMAYEHKNLKGYQVRKQSKCIRDNLKKHFGYNTFFIKPFDIPCHFEVDGIFIPDQFTWLKNSTGLIFNSFIEIQTFIFKYLNYDFTYFVNYEYKGISSDSNSTPWASVSWITDDKKNEIKISKMGRILFVEFQTSVC